MSKIYEALKNAEKGLKGLEKSEFPFPQFSEASSSSKYLELEMEEEMIRLYRNLDSLLPDFKKGVVQFIGSREGEGTSTVIREFAKVLAIKFGKLVLLLDADRHHPSQHVFFNILPDYGWEEVLQNHEPIIDMALYQIEDTRLFISPISSRSAANPQIFDSPRMGAFWEELKQRFDLILVDSPPATTSPDGLALSRKVDAIILVLEAEKTRWPVAESVKDTIIRNGGKILGIVFNKRRYYIPKFIYKRL
jgi:protein-tyrosine kinase